MNETKEYLIGWEAYNKKEPMINNPYSTYSDSWNEWNQGWKDNWYANLQKSVK